MARPRNANPQDTRDRVLAAARTVTLRDGIMAVTVHSVAEEAGVAKSTVGPVARLFEHLIDYVFAALVAEHAGSCTRSGADRWLAYSISAELLASEPDLVVLAMTACTLGTPVAPSGEAADHARYFQQMHLAARKAIATDVMASQQAITSAAALYYAVHVVADYFTVATSLWVEQLLDEECGRRAC
ncbi:MAG: hypothetical protein KF730_07355 [Sphingomonas sp.]|uniref:TetR/AcrR family transcriptional regulator n=1 Tax=Sphingomonas sp. TaxID=28214 RepID=UPI0025CF7C21|nr:hypothetical protein [Sphingomonas sp.]MBX3564378.1 hypothetical protein [Sphingomonas sp.]